jgi:xylan 1,4-beta-xylosidase
MKNKFSNPILPGFHPDPTIIKVGHDFYIATSTFEWYPGVCIYHSRDLENWQLADRPLNSLSKLDMRGDPDSCGIWAPCLSVKDGRIYLAFTNTRRFAGNFKDAPNYYIHTDRIGGDWSEPVYVNSSGFDPSLFHDHDSKSYWLNMVWDHRPAQGRNNFAPNAFFGGILCQEIDLATGKLLGESKNIYRGTPIGLTEGPHLKKRGEYYYLITAEGGTGPHHAVSVARSKDVFGPYETAPNNPLITSALTPDADLRRCGHGDWVDTEEGKGVLVNLCSRPLPYRGRSVMGRETAMHEFVWNDDGWPELSHGGNAPLPITEPAEPKRISEEVDFSKDTLPDTYHSLRYPIAEEDAYIDKDKGAYCLHGQESIGSHFQQSLLARRQQAFQFSYETAVDFEPISFQQMAGLTCYYNSQKFFYLHISHDENRGKVLDLCFCAGEWAMRYPLSKPISIPDGETVGMRAIVDHDILFFEYKLGSGDWQRIDCRMDYSIVSDEMGDGGADANFTGSFVGFCCQDMTGSKLPAYFSYVNYNEI